MFSKNRLKVITGGFFVCFLNKNVLFTFNLLVHLFYLFYLFFPFPKRFGNNFGVIVPKISSYLTHFVNHVSVDLWTLKPNINIFWYILTVLGILRGIFNFFQTHFKPQWVPSFTDTLKQFKSNIQIYSNIYNEQNNVESPRWQSNKSNEKDTSLVPYLGRAKTS